MEVIRNLFTVHKFSWTRGRVSDVSTSNADPVPIAVASNGLEDNTLGETETSTLVELFTVEGEINRHINQNESLSIASEAFGDISSFLQRSDDRIEQFPLPIESAIEENELNSIVVPTSGSAFEFLKDEELVRIETVHLPENTKHSVQKYFQRFICKFKWSSKASVTNTDPTFKPSIHIHTHFDMMYILKTCTYRTRTQNLNVGSEVKTGRLASGIQIAIFVTIVTLSTFQSFCDAKYFLLWFLDGGGLNLLVRFAFDLTNLVSCAYGAYILCNKGKGVTKMVQSMHIYENDWEGKRAKPAISLVLVGITVVLASIKAFRVVDFDEMSIEKILLLSSHELSEDLFLWSSADLNVTTLQLETKYGSGLNTITTLMGVVKILRSFAFSLLQSMIWDIIGNLVLIMFCWMSFFMTFVHTVEENEQHGNEADEIVLEDMDSGENVPHENQEKAIELQRQHVVVWKMYRQIRIVFAAVNEVFGPLLMLFHVTNVLRYAFFMERVIYPEGATLFEYMHLLYDIVKSEIVYLTATNISKQNKVIRKWLRNWAICTGKIDLGYTEKDINVVLDELDEEPLGLGEGDLLISQSFHFGLLGLVSSLFVMLANKTGAKP